MPTTAAKALLPNGLRDVLPPEAALEAHTVDSLLACFAAHGYERVQPPLIEFEESLLAGSAATTGNTTFRVMDPVSQKMMGLRADMTMQVARLATSRLQHEPRPLRLAYAGQVLRVKGSQLRPERQFTQAGIELIGSANPAADAEVIALTAHAVEAVGVARVSMDLNLPTLITAVCDGLDLGLEHRVTLRAALDQKDAAAVRALGGDGVALFSELILCAGDADAVLDRLKTLKLPGAATARRDYLAAVVALVRTLTPALSLTVDAVENRGFEYHTGVSFSLFAAAARGELGRGGRYRAGPDSERAVGATVFVDAITELLPALTPTRRLLLAPADRAMASHYQTEGWVTVAQLDDAAPALTEAMRLRCSHYTRDGAIVAVA